MSDECDRIFVDDAVYFTHEFLKYNPLTDTYVRTSPDSVVGRALPPGGGASVNVPQVEQAEGLFLAGPIFMTARGTWRYTMESSGQVQKVENRTWTAYPQLVPV